MPEYDDHIAVQPAEPARDGVSTLTGDLTEGWMVGGGINGGYQLAVLGQAVRAVLADRGTPDPLAVSAYYLSPATPGPCAVDVAVRRAGRSVSTVAADLRQGPGAGDDVRITALATYGDLSGTDGLPVPTSAEPPDLPPRERCFANTDAPPPVRAMAPLMNRFEMRFHPDHVGWAVGAPSGRGELAAWFRLHDREPDPVSLLTVVDALPPVTFDLGLMGWAPTLELTVHLRARPAPGWLRVRHRTRTLIGVDGAADTFEEDCEVWDSADRLVAQSRQLARVPRPT